MPSFLFITPARMIDPAYWAAQVIDANSTIDVSALPANIDVTLTASSITFTDQGTVPATVYAYSGNHLAAGNFSNLVQFRGNDGDSDVSGSTGLDGAGYLGGAGGDTFTDTGTKGGAMRGGDGDDVITGGSGNNEIHGQGGNDTLAAGTGNDNIYGGDGDDLLTGGPGGGNLHGGAGNDTIIGGDGNNDIQAGSGDDVIYGVRGGGNTNAGSGNDTVYVTAEDVAAGNVTNVMGGSGADTLYVPLGSTVTPSFPTASGGVVTLPAGGGSFQYQSFENVFVNCFGLGTHIRTPTGERLVEDLCVGDEVVTLDHGAREIHWIGQRTVQAEGNLAPIVFDKGVIGNERMLLVSPQHKVLVTGWQAELHFGEESILIPAKSLVNGDTVWQRRGGDVTYFHVSFDTHEIIFSEGAPTESFFAGREALKSLGADAREEFLQLFPEMEDRTGGGHPMVPIRPIVRARDACIFRNYYR